MSSAFLVVAIDFGTTYSGYAFSFLSDNKKNKLNIQSYEWEFENVCYSKTPTSVLFDPRTRFHSFGFEAEAHYATLSARGVHKDWYLFKKFKLTLYKNQSLNEFTTIIDSSGKSMRAMDVFAAGIKYLKDHLMKNFSEAIGRLDADDIHWVLTVPAIWEEAAKQFMRRSANKAGITDNQLTLALEPEAAAVYCKLLPDTNVPVGTPFIVLDCGGGTVDITVHETMSDDKLKEQHKPTGGDWGGIKVDDAFSEFLLEVFGIKSIRALTEMDKLQLQSAFEGMKKKVITESMRTETRAYNIQIPHCLIEQFNASFTYDGRTKLVGDKLKIDADIVRSFFDISAQKILHCLSDVLQHPRVHGLKHVFMVGGFSESKVLQEHVEHRFPQIDIVVPDDAATAVLKGAVIFGHRPDTIGSRVMKYTYGISSCRKYDQNKHTTDNLWVFDGTRYCKNIFRKFIEVDEICDMGYRTPEHILKPLFYGQTKMTINTHSSPNPDPMYVTDAGCKCLGNITVDMPDTTGETHRQVKVKMILGDTELKVEAVDGNTGKLYSTAFEFLNL